MNTQLYIEVASLVTSPLWAYLVFRYIKVHERMLHESLRTLITDSASITRNTVRESKEDLADISLKDHGDTRVFLERVHAQAASLVSQVVAEKSGHAVCSTCKSTVARFTVKDGVVTCKNCSGE